MTRVGFDRDHVDHNAGALTTRPRCRTNGAVYVVANFIGNPRKPVELGNPNTSAEVKLYLFFIYLFRLKK